MSYYNFIEITCKQLDLITPSLANLDGITMKINTVIKLSIDGYSNIPTFQSEGLGLNFGSAIS